MDKTTSKNKKSATAGRRKPTQLDHIEAMLDRLPVDIGLLVSRLDILASIQADLSLLKSGASFMQEMDKAAPQEEQGLEDGDYTDASKEVADALTAMGWGWYDEDRVRLKWIVRANNDASCDQMINTSASRGHKDTHRTNADFLSRARVTAKNLGLVPREEPKEEWKVGDWFWNASRYWKEPQRVDAVKGEQVFTEFEGGLYGYFKSSIVKASPTEIFDHEAKIKAKEEEQKLAKLKFGTRVRTTAGAGIYWRPSESTAFPGKHIVIFPQCTGSYDLSDITIID